MATTTATSTTADNSPTPANTDPMGDSSGQSAPANTQPIDDSSDQSAPDSEPDSCSSGRRHQLRQSTSAIAAQAKLKTEAAIRFAKQAEHLSLLPRGSDDGERAQRTTAVQARFITPRDPVIETASGDRLPAVPLTEAWKLNQLKSQVLGLDVAEAVQDGDAGLEVVAEAARDGEGPSSTNPQTTYEQENEAKAASNLRGIAQPQPQQRATSPRDNGKPSPKGANRTNAPLNVSAPPSHTNPLFPPLPLYGPPSILRSLQCGLFRFTSFFLSLGFLMVIVLGSAFTSLPLMFQHIAIRLTLGDPDARRPFYQKEKERAAAREKADFEWTRTRRRRASFAKHEDKDTEEGSISYEEEFMATEGGKDPLQCDVAYYARRVGLDIEEFKVQTEDGFIITLWHVYNPREYTPASEQERQRRHPEVFADSTAYNPDDSPCSKRRRKHAPKRYPVLLIHGLLQSAGAYCSNDDESLAFYLAKSGYDVWLGNNRCGFHPEHTLLSYGDPRLWCFNIRQMGVLDLPALISRVLAETGFPKLGLVCHSQGTTETFVALAKEQRPELGQRISVFCALAPAVYAGPLIGKMYFKFMKVISPSMFRVFFGIHAFIPFMMTMHACMPGRLYGAMGYRVFSFLFDWSDTRWDRGLRNRMFRFAPVYVSAESMRWWLGRECFAKHKCILATREDGRREDEEDAAEDDEDAADPDPSEQQLGRRAWYDANAPPMALWIAGNDQLVDGRRLLRRFERGREPHVTIVHAKVIPEYEHLDVLWAMDVIDQVGHELKTVLWRTAQHTHGCAVPTGCDSQSVGEVSAEH